VRILGLGGLDHNGSATLLENGAPVAFLELERVTRIKNQGIDGAEALTLLIDRLDPGPVDHVAIADRTWYEARRDWLDSWIEERFASAGRSVFHHHHSHLACGFAASPFERATVLSIDGKGDGWSAAAGHATRGAMPTVNRVVPSAHSLGRLWWAASEYAGLPGHHAAGKTMALAAYGRPRYLDALQERFRWQSDGSFRWEFPGGDPHLFRSVPNIVGWMASQTGEATACASPPGDAHRDMAASVQALTERVVLEFARRAIQQTAIRQVCLAGGVALNGLVNRRLCEEGVVDDLYVPPCTDDRGLSLGAASLAAWSHGLSWRPSGSGLSPYLGPVPSLPDGADEVIEVAARQLAQGAVLAWFEGCDEAGPRALGHRSILASPCLPWMRDHLNHVVKRREAFRPFGCSILREEVARWFEFEGDSPYMLQIARARAELAGQIPAVLHVDQTSRLHTVCDASHPRLARLLRALRDLGHPPLVLNTSLNGPGEPIAHTPEEARAMVRAMGIEGIVVQGMWEGQGEL
jgi:carbamoyltransferase